MAARGVGALRVCAASASAQVARQRFSRYASRPAWAACAWAPAGVAGSQLLEARGGVARTYKVSPTSGEVTGKNLENLHRSDAEELIAKVDVIEVDGDTAVCDGGGGSLGHPVSYINLKNPDDGTVVPCKYCGLRFTMKPH